MPQVLPAMVKGEVMTIPVMGTAVELLLVAATGSEPEVVPIWTCPKGTVAGVRVTDPAGVPVPLRATVS